MLFFCSADNSSHTFIVSLPYPCWGRCPAPKPTRFGGNDKATRNAIVLFSKKPNLILHIFSDFFLLNLTHATLETCPPTLGVRVGRLKRSLGRSCRRHALHRDSTPPLPSRFSDDGTALFTRSIADHEVGQTFSPGAKIVVLNTLPNDDAQALKPVKIAGPVDARDCFI